MKIQVERVIYPSLYISITFLRKAAREKRVLKILQPHIFALRNKLQYVVWPTKIMFIYSHPQS